MSTTRRKFTREFKMAAVKRLQTGFPVGRVARELEVSPNQLHAWRREVEQRPNSAFSGEGRRRQEETAVAELERKIGQQAMESDFLRVRNGRRWRG
jgi:transposase